ncbi:NHL repeat-containing protein [Paraliobacillus sp. X-1268]|uniref:NHL repeat-containing protein n=1 Tax=Paraliobacillus sp. X-1268 TaxID=2213193 RepID=UPI000E3EB86A|nr:NHL repeat-containing protein [Paraliobacillus sp. X-1268]
MKIKYIYLKNVLGEKLNKEKKMKNILRFPTFIHKGENYLYIFDPLIDNSSILLGNFKGIINKISYKRSFKFIEIAFNDHFVGIEQESNNICILNKKGNILRSYRMDPNIDPISLSANSSGDLLLLDRKNKKILLMDMTGLIIKSLSTIKGMKLLFPIHIQSLANGNILLTDEGLHSVFEVDWSGKILWNFGIYGIPGNDNDRLTYPQSACRLNNGNTLITDSMNNRIIEVNKLGQMIWSYGNDRRGAWEKVNLLFPTSAKGTEKGIIIVDSNNGRIIEIDKFGKIINQLGSKKIKKKLLSYPRSIQLLENENLLIADTLNNRVIEFNMKKNEMIKSYNNFFWPRCAKKLGDGKLMITDSLNKKVVFINSEGKQQRIIKGFWLNKKFNYFVDPHYAIQLSNKNVVIADSGNHIVVEVNQNNEATWIYGEGNESLNDPHYLSRNKFSETLIADSGNNRIVLVDYHGNIFLSITEVPVNDKMNSVHFPRYCEFIDDNNFLFIDGGSGYIYVYNRLGNLLEYFKPSDQNLALALINTRSILFDEEKLLISDYNNGRILICSM